MARIAFFLIALIMFATAKPLAHGQLIGSTLNVLLRLLSGLFGFPVVPGIPVPLTPTVPPTLINPLSPLVQGLNITGRLCCTPTGTCNATGVSQPLSGALVTLNCPGNQLGTGSLVVGFPTNFDGFFNISVPNAIGALLSLTQEIPCNLTVNVNQVVCPVLSGVGGAVGTVLGVVLQPVALVVDLIRGLILILRLNLAVGA